MRKIANILTDKKFTEDSTFYNVVSSVDGLIPNLPTLIIGWNFAKSLYPDANIVNWKINDNTYFTFGSREKRSAYLKRIEKFKEIAVDNFIKSVKYEFFSVITKSNHEKAEFLNFIVNGSEKKDIYIANNGMMYIYIPSKNAVYGILLSDVEYIGKNEETFVAMIYRGSEVENVNEKVSKNINLSILNDFKNCLYIVPCLVTDNA